MSFRSGGANRSGANLQAAPGFRFGDGCRRSELQGVEHRL